MDIDTQIAERLKALRALRGWTLQQLAQASGVSRAMISKVEHGQASATAALLSRLCNALQVPLSELLAPPLPASAVSRKADRQRWQDPATGFLREIVSPRAAGSAVEVVEVELPARGQVDYRLGAPAGYTQHIVVLSGGLRIHQGGVAHDLNAGDALFMTPAGEVRFENPAARPCRYLVVLEHARRTG